MIFVADPKIKSTKLFQLKPWKLNFKLIKKLIIIGNRTFWIRLFLTSWSHLPASVGPKEDEKMVPVKTERKKKKENEIKMKKKTGEKLKPICFSLYNSRKEDKKKKKKYFSVNNRNLQIKPERNLAE